MIVNIHAIETKHGVHLAYESSYYQFSVKFLLCVYNLSFPDLIISPERFSARALGQEKKET